MLKTTSRISFLLGIAILFQTKTAQCQNTTDSIQKIQEITVRAYLSQQPLLSTPSSISIVNQKQFSDQPGISLLPVMNTVPGVRMEERSPGSYRLSIRGSLLRSPFGVRNVKVYLDEIPLTDAGGNTYLNSIDVASIHSMEILKGPDGSLFGANSGGVVLLNPVDKDARQESINLTIGGGSYGLFQEKIAGYKKWNRTSLNVSHAFQQSNGYREHSALKRNYGQAVLRQAYGISNEIRLLAFYSDLNYQTPGGLTAAQYDDNPALARPSSATIPGPVAQQARIINKTFFTGLINEAFLAPNFKHVITVFGSLTDFKNPFISNYELRAEQTAGMRSYFELIDKSNHPLNWKFNAGLELQQTWVDFTNYDNNSGVIGELQAQDNIEAMQAVYFSRLSINPGKIHAELSLSYNSFGYQFDKEVSSPESRSTLRFSPQLMPRAAISYQTTDRLAFRSSISRGYSTPTTAEVRASDNIINRNLEAETGWNLEAGTRFSDLNSRFWLDGSVFSYKLQNAIVRRVNADDTEFYQNAGGTSQRGLEVQSSYWLVEPVNRGLLRGLQIQNSYTHSRYFFRQYQSGTSDYSGNRLTGSPENVIVTGIDARLGGRLNLFVQHNYTSRIPLNDANTVFADRFNLIHAKLGWKSRIKSNLRLELYGGIDNLLNEKYSLGNDLNAFGGRYFNAAASRNFFLGIKANLIRSN